MDLKLAGRRAVITGGTRGIGWAIAETLAAEGAAVALCARDGAAVAARVAELTARGARATGAAIDVADGPALAAWIDQVAADLGGIEILVSNPGAMAVGNSVEDWRRNFDVDILGARAAIEAAKPHLLKAGAETGDASIILISTVSTMEADGESAYGPVKAALTHMAKGIARQNAKAHLRANVVSPGTVYFEGGVWQTIERAMPDRFRDALARNPTGRMATPQDIADAVAFLASPRAGFITGVNLPVEGAISRRVHY